MNFFHYEFAELLAWTKLYLLQEHPHVKLNTTSQSLLPPTPSPVKPESPPAQPQEPIAVKTIEPPKPPPVAQLPQQKSESTRSKFLTLEPLPPAPELDLSDVRTLVAEHFPALKTVNTIPSDEEAKRITSAWKQSSVIPAYIILSFDEPDKHRAFLENISRAIQATLGPAQIMSAQKIENENGWTGLLRSSDLRLIIASDRHIRALPGLMAHYRESSRDGEHYLGKVRLQLLPDLSIYWQQPRLKEALWKAIK